MVEWSQSCLVWKLYCYIWLNPVYFNISSESLFLFLILTRIYAMTYYYWFPNLNESDVELVCDHSRNHFRFNSIALFYWIHHVCKYIFLKVSLHSCFCTFYTLSITTYYIMLFFLAICRFTPYVYIFVHQSSHFILLLCQIFIISISTAHCHYILSLNIINRFFSAPLLFFLPSSLFRSAISLIGTR